MSDLLFNGMALDCKTIAEAQALLLAMYFPAKKEIIFNGRKYRPTLTLKEVEE